MIKKLLVVSLAAMGIGLTGCLLDPEESTAPTITLENIGTLTAGSGVLTPKAGKIEASDNITNVVYKVYDAQDNEVSTTLISVSGSPAIQTKKSMDITVNLQAFSGALTGSYNLKISATSTVTADVKFPFSVTGTVAPVGTPVVEKILTLGAQNSANPSLLDADDMTAYSSNISDAATQAKIDLIFSYATVLANDALAFTSPSVAAGTPYSTWASTSKASTEFKTVATTWASIVRQGQIDTLWGTAAGSTRLTVAQGDIVAVKTSAGVYKLVQINTLTGTAGNASISIKGLY